VDGWEILLLPRAALRRNANAEKRMQTYSNSELRVNDTSVDKAKAGPE
jgi:hypothetical protein